MLIVYNETNEEVINNMGMNSLYPNGKIPNLPQLPEGVIYLTCYDDSELADVIMNAKEYTLQYDSEGNITDVTVLQTLEEYKDGNPPPATDKERIEELELVIADLMGGV